MVYRNLALKIPGKLELACVIHSHCDHACVVLFNMIYTGRKNIKKGNIIPTIAYPESTLAADVLITHKIWVDNVINIITFCLIRGSTLSNGSL